MARQKLYLLSFLALIGFGLSVFSTQHYYDIHTGTSGFKSFCNISQQMNCDLVTASSYSDLFGIPVSSLGAALFLSLFLISLFAFNRFWRREAVRASLVLTAAGTVFSLILLGIMVFRLKTFCLLCLGIDATLLAALATTLSLKPEGLSEHKLNLKYWKTFAGLSLAGAFVTLIGLKGGMETFSFPASQVEEQAQSILGVPAVPVKVGPEFPSIGPQNAKITIVEFSDFQCPFCKMAALSINSVMNRFPGQIRIVFRNYPLNQSCNSRIHQTAHPAACEAAKAALCGFQQGHFREAYETLFENQESFVPGKPTELAKAIGLDATQLEGCMHSPETQSQISRDVEDGSVLGVQSTPTFFINGHRIEGAIAAPVWIRIVEALLAESLLAKPHLAQ